MKPLSIFTFCLLMALNGFSQDKKVAQDSLGIDTMKVQDAEFPGGAPGWARFISKNLNYPKSAIKNHVQGVVVVKFIVDVNGNISDVMAIEGPDELRAEAVRVVKKSPKWTPAQKNGKAAKSYKRQPITFRLG
ncbi:TonB family protein [Chitinophagaceae bacterium 26-R-25]|nr:TonB family protein [Chitinophagaceae bacterium 26-R-25]